MALFYYVTMKKINFHTQAFAQQCLEVGAFLLEAPITGGIDGLKRGQMTSFLAGDKQTADEVTPIIQASCTSVLYLGPLGNALVVKVTKHFKMPGWPLMQVLRTSYLFFYFDF